MTRRGIGAVVLALAALIALSGSVLASPSTPVTIIAVTQIDVESPFETVDGPLCDSGTVFNAKGQFVGWQSDSHAQVTIVKQFDCDDGSFWVSLRATVDFATCDTVGTWSVLRGTGAYSRLRGAGSITGASECDGVIVDTYVGSVHVD